MNSHQSGAGRAGNGGSDARLTAAPSDRGTLRRLHLGRPGLPRSFGHPHSALALGALAAVAVLVAGALTLTVWASPPVAPKSPRPIASPTTGSSTVPSSPSISATPTDAPAGTRQELAQFTSPGIVAWSPDGSHFAIEEAQARGTSSFEIFDRDGSTAGSPIEAGQFAWLSGTSYVVANLDQPTSADWWVGTCRAFIGRLGSDSLEPIGPVNSAVGLCDGLVTSPTGAVALTLPWNGTLASRPQFVVMVGAVRSGPFDGLPAAWSRDGTELAVFHPTSLSRALDHQVTPSGWLEVVRPTGETIVSVHSVHTSIFSQVAFSPVEVAFSPDGSRLAFRDDTYVATKGEQIGVLEVRTGALAWVPTFGPFTWASADQLLFADLRWDKSGNPNTNPAIHSWSANTERVGTYASGEVVTASGQGVVIVGVAGAVTWSDWSTGHSGTWTFDGDLGCAWSPATGSALACAIQDSAWSPDRSAVVLIRSYGVWYQMAFVARF